MQPVSLVQAVLCIRNTHLRKSVGLSTFGMTEMCRFKLEGGTDKLDKIIVSRKAWMD